MRRYLFWFVVFTAKLTYSRHFYPYTHHPSTPSYPPRQPATEQPFRSVNEVTVVDQKTGIQYNPYSKHHPGRHVCIKYRNVSYPVRTKKVVCKPTYKKYMVRCGTQWCEGVRLVYENYHKDIVSSDNHTLLDYTCCPGWTQVTWTSHGCNKPVCQNPCLNGGRCVQPNQCMCPSGYAGHFCEQRTTTYGPECHCGGNCTAIPPQICPNCLRFSMGGCAPCQNSASSQCQFRSVSCPALQLGAQSCCSAHCQTAAPCQECKALQTCPQNPNAICECADSSSHSSECPCQNGGSCSTVGSRSSNSCVCPPGYTGTFCEKDIDECKQLKPCDHICYNTIGSYKCECKENFVLQNDRQSCRSEYDGGTLESFDSDDLRISKIDVRLSKLEKLMQERRHNEVSKGDISNIYGHINKISNDINSISHKLHKLVPSSDECCSCKTESTASLGTIYEEG